MQPLEVVVTMGSQEHFWADLLTRIASIFSELFVLASFALTYWHSVKVRAGDLLLKLEETFNKLGSKLHFIECKKTCYEPIKNIFQNAVTCPDSLRENERKILMDVDECIRFLYLCTLHAGDRIVIPRIDNGSLKKISLMDKSKRILYPSRLP